MRRPRTRSRQRASSSARPSRSGKGKVGRTQAHQKEHVPTAPGSARPEHGLRADDLARRQSGLDGVHLNIEARFRHQRRRTVFLPRPHVGDQPDLGSHRDGDPECRAGKGRRTRQRALPDDHARWDRRMAKGVDPLYDQARVRQDRQGALQGGPPQVGDVLQVRGEFGQREEHLGGGQVAAACAGRAPPPARERTSLGQRPPERLRFFFFARRAKIGARRRLGLGLGLLALAWSWSGLPLRAGATVSAGGSSSPRSIRCRSSSCAGPPCVR